METITKYFQFKRQFGNIADPLISFVEINGEPRAIEDVLLPIKDRYQEVIEYKTKDEYFKARKNSFGEESRIRKSLQEIDKHVW